LVKCAGGDEFGDLIREVVADGFAGKEKANPTP
jgi:hypothetical protein